MHEYGSLEDRSSWTSIVFKHVVNVLWAAYYLPNWNNMGSLRETRRERPKSAPYIRLKNIQ